MRLTYRHTQQHTRASVHIWYKRKSDCHKMPCYMWFSEYYLFFPVVFCAVFVWHHCDLVICVATFCGFFIRTLLLDFTPSACAFMSWGKMYRQIWNAQSLLPTHSIERNGNKHLNSNSQIDTIWQTDDQPSRKQTHTHTHKCVTTHNAIFLYSFRGNFLSPALYIEMYFTLRVWSRF